MDAAKGEYLFFMDSDDYLFPTHLSQYAAVMGNYDIVFQGYRMFDNFTNETVETCCLDEMSSDTDGIMGVLGRVFNSGNQFGSAWSKIFRGDIIEKRNIRFKNDISIREDEVFVFEYCQYAQRVKVLNTATYNYRMTPNSLMRRKYMSPAEIFKAVSYSYQAALQLPLTAEFREHIEIYYRDSLRWVYKVLYYPGHLAARTFRMQIYDALVDWDKKHSQLSTGLTGTSFQIIDAWMVLKYVVKTLIRKVLKLR